MESWVQSWRPCTNAFCDVSTPPVYSTAPATVIRSAALVTQNQTWRSDAPKLTPLRKSAPWPPNISDEHVSCTAPAAQKASLQILFKSPTPASAFETATKPSRFAHFWQFAKSFAPATQNDIWTFKSALIPSVFHTFHLEMCFAPQRRALFQHVNFQQCSKHGVTCKCASHHNGVHFFDMSTSKSVPSMVCFAHFDLEMCFAPQQCALFQHVNFQRCSKHGVFCTFWLGNVLRATTACTFPTCQLPKVPRAWCALYILTWKFASRHNSVQFFISQLVRWLRTRRFSDPTFRRSWATNHWEQWLATFLAHLHLLSSDSFSSLIFLLLHCSSLTLPTSAFSSVHIVGSLTSKLPSIITYSLNQNCHVFWFNPISPCLE